MYTPNRFVLRSVAAALMVALASPMGPVAWAGNHPLSAVADVNTIDYVVNVDWDFDSPPSQVANAAQLLDRAYITSVLRTMAQSKFTMTEGRHRVGTVWGGLRWYWESCTGKPMAYGHAWRCTPGSMLRCGGPVGDVDQA